MSSVKERLFGAITVMSETDAAKLWEFIQQTYNGPWAQIEEESTDKLKPEMTRPAQPTAAQQTADRWHFTMMTPEGELMSVRQEDMDEYLEQYGTPVKPPSGAIDCRSN